MTRPLRKQTPIPVEVNAELWLTQDDEGNWLLSGAIITDRATGKGCPGAYQGKVRVLHPGTHIAIVLP